MNTPTITPGTARDSQPLSTCCDAPPMDGFEDRCSDCRESCDFETLRFTDGELVKTKDGIIQGEFPKAKIAVNSLVTVLLAFSLGAIYALLFLYTPDEVFAMAASFWGIHVN